MKTESKHFVGYWHYGVILTYMSLACAVCAICFATAAGGERRPDIAAFFVLMSALCDAFDGMVAKTRKNRTLEDMSFGMNIDSLSDMVSFGVAPLMIGVGMALTRWYYVFFYIAFALCGLVRLAYFDVTEAKRLFGGETGRREAYEGLPITNAGLAMPVFYLIATMFSNSAWMSDTNNLIYESVIMMTGYALCAFLFVFRFRMPKAGPRGLAITVASVTVLTITLSLVRWYVFGVVLFAPLTRYPV